MTDNPYINKQNWGRDLLDRLNNFSDDDGSFNVWDELPTTGKDGQALGQSHKGLAGVYQSNSFTKIISWDGNKWNTLIETPYLSSIPETDKDVFINRTGECYFFHPTIGSQSLIELKANNDGFVYITLLSKDGSILWSNSFGLPSACLHFHSPRVKILGDLILIRLIPVSTIGIYWQETFMSVACINFATGAFLWQTSFTKGSNVGEGSGDFCIGENSNIIFVRPLSPAFIHAINPSTGTVLSTNSIGTFTEIMTGIIYYDIISNVYLFGGKGWNTASPTNLYRISNTFVVLNTFNLGSASDFFWRNEWDNWLLHSLATREIYFSRKINGTLTLSKYSILSNQITNIATSEADIGFLYSFNTASSKYYFSDRKILIETTITPDNKLKMDKPYLPTSKGLLEFPIDCIDMAGRGIIFYFFKINRTLKGNFPFSVVNETNIGSSFGKNALILFSNPYLSDTQDLNSIQSRFNIDQLGSSFIKSNILDSRNISFSHSLPSTTNISQVEIKNPAGIRSNGDVGFIHVYAGELSGSQQSYASGDRIRTAGILFGAENRAGRIFHGWTDDGAAGIVYDHVSARLLICNSGPESSAYVQKTSFPNSNGLVVDSANKFGIGTYSPAFKLDVNGEMRATVVRNSGGVITSDPMLKVNMLSLSGEDLWSVCQQLNPITFLYKPDFEVKINEVEKDENGNDVISVISQKWPLPQGIQYGYNAAEVELLFPELVSEDPQGIKYLNSGALFPIFQSAAVAKIQSLESEVESLKQLVQSLVARIEVLENA